MPYASKADLPDQVKDNLTEHEQEVFMAAFNSAYDGTCKEREDRDECAFKIAWSAAKKTDDKKKEESFVREKPRYFNLSLGERKFDRTEAGFVVRDVIALAEGCWTDSHIGTPCFYSGGALKSKFNIKDNGLWSRHAGSIPRAISEKIGIFEDAGYDEQRKARLVNMILHLKSQASRDIAEMIEGGVINAVSAEVGGEEWYNRKMSRAEALTIDIYGLATVDKGACETCLIRYKEKPQDMGAENEGNNMADEETTKKFADLDARLKALEELLKKDSGAEEKKEESKKEEVDATAKLISEMKDELAKVGERVKALEIKPNAQTKVDPGKKDIEYKPAGDLRVDGGGGITRS